jgi:hypothetical protein
MLDRLQYVNIRDRASIERLHFNQILPFSNDTRVAVIRVVGLVVQRMAFAIGMVSSMIKHDVSS